MDGRSYSPTRIAASAILVVASAMLLVAAALAGPARNAAASGPASAGKVGGTLRVNLSTTDVQYTDPSLEYESTGWQVEYATALKLLNWRETKATLFPEAATSFNSGIEIFPSGRTGKDSVRSGSFHTEICSMSFAPIT